MAYIVMAKNSYGLCGYGSFTYGLNCYGGRGFNSDIGCAGHKNAKGQAEVAQFLDPQIRRIMGWN